MPFWPRKARTLRTRIMIASDPVIEAAPAKLNLCLHVTGQQADGYHLLDSIVCFASIGDRITVAEADDLHLNVTGPFAAGLDAEADNLVLRAARLFGSGRGAAITLDKQLPPAMRRRRCAPCRACGTCRFPRSRPWCRLARMFRSALSHS